MRIESGKEEIIRYCYVCDLCGKGVSQHRTCGICGRDLCTDCTRFDPRDIGDYPEKYCSDCFDIGKKYLNQIDIEQKKFDTVVEELESKWREEATSRAISSVKAKQGKN